MEEQVVNTGVSKGPERPRMDVMRVIVDACAS